MGAGPAHALHFATYEYCKEKFCYSLNNAKFQSTISNQVIASSAAGAIATFAHDALMTPFDGKLYKFFFFFSLIITLFKL